MHGAPEAGGANSTNWHTYSVPEMWSMLEDFDTNPQWRHVGGWRKTFELTGLHLRRMRSYRDQLATAWPPERNEASRVYVAELDKLIASVQATYDAAVANHEAMSAATAAISSARFKLKPIYDRWQAQASTTADYVAKMATAKSGTPVPLPEPPPLPPDWHESLNAEARAVMNSTSNEIALASYQLTNPPTYVAPQATVIGEQGEEVKGKSMSAALQAPVIPRVVPRPSQSTSPAPTNASGGPALGSTLYRDRSAMSAGMGMPVGQPSTNSPVPGMVAPLPVRTLPGVASPGNGSAIRRTPQPTASNIRGAVVAPGGNAPRFAPRSMPPGGVIGAVPTVGLGQPAARSVQRVNPVGGIINGVGPSAAAGTRPSASTSGFKTGGPVGSRYRTSDGHLVTISGMRGQRREPRDVERWDPDDPWTTEEGVMPIIEPTLAPTRSDPGPAIGLSQ